MEESEVGLGVCVDLGHEEAWASVPPVIHQTGIKVSPPPLPPNNISHNVVLVARDCSQSGAKYSAPQLNRTIQAAVK